MAEARRRSRYANDNQVERAAEMALKLGVKLHLDADGGVSILGRLDSANDRAPSEGEDDADAAEEIRLCREALKGGGP